MIPNGCTLYCMVAILATVTFAMGVPIPDADDSQQDSGPFYRDLMGTRNLNPQDVLSSYVASKRYVESSQPFKRESYNQMYDQTLSNPQDVLSSYVASKRYVESSQPFKRESYNQIYDRTLSNMYKRSRLEDLIRRLEILRGNQNKKGTARAHTIRFGPGKRK